MYSREKLLAIHETERKAFVGNFSQGIQIFIDDFEKAEAAGNFDVIHYGDDIEKAGKKNLSKLIRTQVVGKDGVKRTVWVKPNKGEAPKAKKGKATDANGLFLKHMWNLKQGKMSKDKQRAAIKNIDHSKLSHINKIRYEKEFKNLFGKEYSKSTEYGKDTKETKIDKLKSQGKATEKKPVKPKPLKESDSKHKKAIKDLKAIKDTHPDDKKKSGEDWVIEEKTGRTVMRRGNTKVDEEATAKMDPIPVHNSKPAVSVKVYGGKSESYTKDELQEMLDDKKMYKDADNLPKWLKSAGFGGWNKVYGYIQDLVDNYGTAITVDVSSDRKGGGYHAPDPSKGKN